MRLQDGKKIPAVLIVEDEPLVRLGGWCLPIFTCRAQWTGLKLAHAVRNRWPPIKIIVTSGRHLITEKDLPEGGRFFAKPYNHIQITEVLRGWAL
jgi:hypothetical protein